MKKLFYILTLSLLIASMTTSVVLAGGNARRPAIDLAAARVVSLQRTDPGWEGTWYWTVGSTSNVINLTGVTALGLLEAYRDTGNSTYLDAAIDAAGFIMEHLGIGATGTPYHVRTTAPDIIFLHLLSSVTGDPSYSTRANTEWNNIKTFWPTAAALDATFQGLNRPSTWDIAFYMEAAYLSGDSAWADGAAAILANTSDAFYYNTASSWYALNVSASIRALIYCGYGAQYYTAVTGLIGSLIGLIDDENGIGGYVQDTAYAVIALRTVGGAAHKYANDLGRWIASQQNADGGWTEADGNEYPEIDGEALRALASTIGTNVTLDGFDYGASEILNSSWVKSINSQQTIPFSGD